MKLKTTKILGTVFLVIAAVGVYTLMLKNPDDILFNLPVLLSVMAALALSQLKPKK